MSFMMRVPESGILLEAPTNGFTIVWDSVTRMWGFGPAGGGGNVDSVFGRTGVVVAVAGDYDSDQIDNLSGVAGLTVSDALDNLEAAQGGTVLQTGTALTDANQSLATSQRYVQVAGSLTADRTKTLTPGTSGRAFLIEVGTQGAGLDELIVNGGPNGGTLWTVAGGAREAVWAVSDGTDLVLAAVMPLAEEPSV